MSTETIDKPVKKESEAFLSKRRKKIVTDPLSDDNPITIQVLGICSALAVTTQMKPNNGNVNCGNICGSIFKFNYFID